MLKFIGDDAQVPRADHYWSSLFQTALPLRPTGLGTSAARIADQILKAARSGELDPHPPTGGDPAFAMRPWGDRTASPLYCPVTERINEPLADEVDRRLLVWAKDVGFDKEALERTKKARLGRLMVLAHTDCEDPDRLVVGAELNAAAWFADDIYSDEVSLGAAPEKLPPRLLMIQATMAPLPPAGEFSRPFEEAVAAEPVLVAFRSGMEHLQRYATPAQVHRLCYNVFGMFGTWNSYAAWRFTGEYPPAWKYLVARTFDSFVASMALIDVLGGYILTEDLFHEPRVRQAFFLSATAAVLVNDLYSVAKDMEASPPRLNMVLQISADEGCSIGEATERTVALHNDLVRDFEAKQEELKAVPSVELQRFLRGMRDWMAGAFHWHDTSRRYRER